MSTGDQIAALAHDENFSDRDGLVGAIVALALDGEPIGDEYAREYSRMEQGDAILWCEEAIRVRGRMASREEI